MDFVNDYLLFNSGNMSPKRYHMWCALSVLAATMGRKIYVDQEYYPIYPNLFVCLVGRQGFRKGSAKDNAREMFTSVFPDHPIGPSVVSREKIVERMSSDDFLRTYTDENGALVSWKPLAFFINELKNFLSINPSGMIEFLTDIYDRKAFDASTIKHGLQLIINPCVNILACETPGWIIDKLKLNIISGGFSRRLLFVYEVVRPPRITFPHKTKEAIDAEQRCKEHLLRIDKLVGPFSWEPSSKPFFDKWFVSLPEQTDEIMEGFYEAKDTLAIKLAMLLAVAEYEPKLVLTIENLSRAISLLDGLEENLPRLTVAAGRNELAVPQQRMMEALEKNGGFMSMTDLTERLLDKDMSPTEQRAVIYHLRGYKRLYSEQANGEEILFLPAAWKKYNEERNKPK